MRFRFQIHELTVELPTPDDGRAGSTRWSSGFIENYELRFGEGSAFTAAGVEFVNWRVVATGPARARRRSARGAGGEAPAATPRAATGLLRRLDATPTSTTRTRCRPAQFAGPAIFELPDTNIVDRRPARTREVDAHGNVIIDPHVPRPDGDRG